MRKYAIIFLLLIIAGCLYSIARSFLNHRSLDLISEYKERGDRAFLDKNFAEAEKQYRSSLQEAEKWGADNTIVAVPLRDLASMYNLQGRFTEAEPLYLRSLAIEEKRNDPQSLPLRAYEVAIFYVSNKKFAEAEPFFERAQAVSEKTFGPESLEYAKLLTGRAELYRFEGRCAEAEPFYLKGLALEEKASGAGDALVVAVEHGYAKCLRNLRRDAEADEVDARASKYETK